MFVEPGKQFILGGDQLEGFRVAAHNTGPVPVALRERLCTGAVVARGNLAPGQRATLRFAPARRRWCAMPAPGAPCSTSTSAAATPAA
ncbi:MAG: hypothetical protein WKG07_00585 [Hymenobacter sp.]